MTVVDENRLKGNYGAAHVAARLSGQCLVRPVASDTDVGVDLYCETVEEQTPFLHFWVQVKAGAQCHVMQDSCSASCSFQVEHLSYWHRQPVPVFAALVPVDWPVTQEPRVYLVDISSQLIDGIDCDGASISLRSNHVWRPNNRDDVDRFLRVVVPVATARLAVWNGVVGKIPTVNPNYVYTTPDVPVARYKDNILKQLRKTAAFSILQLHYRKEIGSQTATFRRTLAAIVEQFHGDRHWENFMAQALSCHADDQFVRAIEFYNTAIECIQCDRNVATVPSWQLRVAEIESLRNAAINGSGLNAICESK